MGHHEELKRWYRIRACQSKSVGAFQIEWSQQVVDAYGIAEAFDKVLVMRRGSQGDQDGRRQGAALSCEVVE